MSSLPFFRQIPFELRLRFFASWTFQLTLMRSKPVFFLCLKREEGLSWPTQSYYDWSFFFCVAVANSCLLEILKVEACRFYHFWYPHSNLFHIFPLNLKKFRNQIPRNNSKMELSRDILKPVELWWKIMVLLTCFGVGVPLVGNFLELD